MTPGIQEILEIKRSLKVKRTRSHLPIEARGRRAAACTATTAREGATTGTHRKRAGTGLIKAGPTTEAKELTRIQGIFKSQSRIESSTGRAEETITGRTSGHHTETTEESRDTTDQKDPIDLSEIGLKDRTDETLRISKSLRNPNFKISSGSRHTKAED